MKIRIVLPVSTEKKNYPVGTIINNAVIDSRTQIAWFDDATCYAYPTEYEKVVEN